MEINAGNLQALSTYLQQTLSPNAAVRKQAETFLASVEDKLHYPLLVLSLLSTDGVDPQVRMAAAVLFKNFVKHHWADGDDERLATAATAGGSSDAAAAAAAAAAVAVAKIHEADRGEIRRTIVDLMLTNALPAIQKQLSEAVTIIADVDFPAKWSNLLQELMQRINLQDVRVTNGILHTAHSIFRRYQNQMPSKELFDELRFVLSQFTTPLLQLLEATDQMITANAANAAALPAIFDNLNTICSIFYSLNYQEIPEFFEDHMNQFFAIFMKYLTYSNPLLESASEDQAGPLETIRAAVCEIVDLYAQRYEDVFSPLLPQFISTVWNLLTTIDSSPKNDELVSTALRFIGSVAKHERHRQNFSDEQTIRTICERIVVPNIEFRQSDEELFEDNPMDYIRKDMEGSDVDTRRRAAADLIRNLVQQFESEVTRVFSLYIQNMLQKYQENPAANWKQKDSAIVLVIALAVKTVTASKGATSTNALVNIGDFYTRQILPLLQTDPNAGVPILKADAIKYLHVFRSQIPKEGLLAVIPYLVKHLEAKNVVVHSYAAICIERILAIKIAQEPIFSPQELSPFLQLMFGKLFAVIDLANGQPDKTAENDYVMNCVMRVIIAAKTEVKPLMFNVVTRLAHILTIISKNPSNPRFNHYLFESLSGIIRYVTITDGADTARLERLLFPPFEFILQQDIAEFTPYVFQILSQMLELNKAGSLPEPYAVLLDPLLSASLWSSQGNITPLVRLLRAYFKKSSSQIVANNKLDPILGIFQKLVASKANDQEGFHLLSGIIETVPTDVMEKYLKPVLALLLQRLSQAKTTRYVCGLITFLCLYMARIENGATHLITNINSLKPGLFEQLMTNVFLEDLQKVNGNVERHICAIGLIKLLTTCNLMFQDPYFALWSPLLMALLKLIVLPEESADDLDDEEHLQIEDYQSVYSKLAFAQEQDEDPVKQYGDPRALLVVSLMTAANSHPGKLPAIIRQLPPDANKVLLSYFETMAVNFSALA